MHGWRRLLAALAIILHLGCGASQGPEATNSASIQEDPGVTVSIPPFGEPHPIVQLTTQFGTIALRLDATRAPTTVNNFLHYVNSGRYDGTIFHHIAPDSILLGGGFTPNLQPIETSKPIRNEADNGLQNRRGTVAMLRDPDSIDSATCQFFINLADNEGLDHIGDDNQSYGYCVFGEISEGMEVIDQIAAQRRHDEGDFVNTPVERIVIQSVRQLR